MNFGTDNKRFFSSAKHNPRSQKSHLAVCILNVFTCALWGFHQPLPQDLPYPSLHLCPAFSAHYRNHQVRCRKVPVGNHQVVDQRRGGVPWQTQELITGDKMDIWSNAFLLLDDKLLDFIKTHAKLYINCLGLVWNKDVLSAVSAFPLFSQVWQWVRD